MVSERMETGSAVCSSYWVSTVSSALAHFHIFENSQMKMLVPAGNATCRDMGWAVNCHVAKSILNIPGAADDPKILIVTQKWKGHGRAVFPHSYKNK